jgi:hypothetical protein
VVAAELVMLAGRRYEREHVRLTAATLIGTGIPLLYDAILGQADINWKLAQQAASHAFSFRAIALGVLPLLVPAIVVYRTRPTTFLAAATRCWPLGAFAIFLLSGTKLGGAPIHAFQGITVPLSVLAVQGLTLLGWRRLPRPVLIGALLVALFTIPANLKLLSIAHTLAAPTPGNGNFIKRDEKNAVDYLAHVKEPGSVITQPYLGALIPGRTGRHTYIGDCLWSEPNCFGRATQMRALFNGSLGAAAARSFVRSSGARFVLSDCRTSADMRTLLGPVIRSAHGFGCATVYEVE